MALPGLAKPGLALKHPLMAKPDLSPEDRRAWARVARSVQPLEGVDDAALMARAMRAMLSPAKIPDPAHSSPAPARTVKASPPRRASISNRSNERRIRKGQTAITAQLDLHGHTQASAARILPDFLETARVNGARSVLVITGKGERGEGVLRRNFLHWMSTEAAAKIVSGYAQAHRKHGGSGAYYVFLRRV